MADVLRIANCSGFYGDRLSAAREMVEGGPIDVLTGDYLAELTLMILLKDRLKDQSLGYARTFLRQLEEIAAACAALERGADLVICPRVTDAALTLGPAAWRFGWKRDDWDALAAGVVAGHIIECGAQCTGGNYAFFKEVRDLRHPGFPIAEMRPDG